MAAESTLHGGEYDPIEYGVLPVMNAYRTYVLKLESLRFDWGYQAVNPRFQHGLSS